jgi:hypothetical protein
LTETVDVPLFCGKVEGFGFATALFGIGFHADDWNAIRYHMEGISGAISGATAFLI